jgi:hypothetical protein
MIASSGRTERTWAQQLDTVAGLADDIEPGAVQQASQALTQQDIVVGKHNPECAPGLRRFSHLWCCRHIPIIDHGHQ